MTNTSNYGKEATMARKGMDVDQVRSFGSQTCSSIREQLSGMKGTVTNAVQSLQWEGPDAATFKNDRLADVTRIIEQLMTAVEDYGRTAVQNADAQQAVSSAI